MRDTYNNNFISNFKNNDFYDKKLNQSLIYF